MEAWCVAARVVAVAVVGHDGDYLEEIVLWLVLMV